jgi:hypothetical protein
MRKREEGARGEERARGKREGGRGNRVRRGSVE